MADLDTHCPDINDPSIFTSDWITKDFDTHDLDINTHWPDNSNPSLRLEGGIRNHTKDAFSEENFSIAEGKSGWSDDGPASATAALTQEETRKLEDLRGWGASAYHDAIKPVERKAREYQEACRKDVAQGAINDSVEEIREADEQRKNEIERLLRDSFPKATNAMHSMPGNSRESAMQKYFKWLNCVMMVVKKLLDSMEKSHWSYEALWGKDPQFVDGCFAGVYGQLNRLCRELLVASS